MAEVNNMSDEQLKAAIKDMEAAIRKEKNDFTNLQKQTTDLEKRLKENREKLKLSTQLPHMVANIGELLDPEVEDDETGGTDGSGFASKKTGNKKEEKKEKSVVIKTTGRHTVYLPVPGLIDSDELKPGELVAVNKESYIIYEKLPPEYDSRVMAMEVDERPKEDYTDIGGLDKQIEELTEAIVLPMTHKERFINIGIRPPKGLLLHGPPGTGKTLMARACAAQTKSTFLKLAGPQLVQMYIGDGAKMIRDAFDLAREKAPTIIFIDELDAIGTKRGSGEGETREVHRTMLELLNQLDGFT